MSTAPEDQDALLAEHQAKPARRQPRPRQAFCAFVSADDVRFYIEFVDDGLYGIDVQIFRNEQFSDRRRATARVGGVSHARMNIAIIESIVLAAR